MLGHAATFVGLARDCGASLPSVLANLAVMAKLYRESTFVFAVSDTEDDTRDILERWLASGRKGHVLDLGVLRQAMPLRTVRLAYLRNLVLDEVLARRPEARSHLVVADLDEVLAEPIDAVAFSSAARWLDADPARAAVFANASPRYYDIWALRHHRWCPNDCWHAIWSAGDSTRDLAKFRQVLRRQIRIPPTAAPIEVTSAFGGLGIYRMSRVGSARYAGLDPGGREICEHVAFNAGVAGAGGRLFVYPPLRVRAPLQHLCRPSEFGWRWRLAGQGFRLREFLWPTWPALYDR